MYISINECFTLSLFFSLPLSISFILYYYWASFSRTLFHNPFVTKCSASSLSNKVYEWEFVCESWSMRLWRRSRGAASISNVLIHRWARTLKNYWNDNCEIESMKNVQFLRDEFLQNVHTVFQECSLCDTFEAIAYFAGINIYFHTNKCFLSPREKIKKCQTNEKVNVEMMEINKLLLDKKKWIKYK